MEEDHIKSTAARTAVAKKNGPFYTVRLRIALNVCFIHSDA